MKDETSPGREDAPRTLEQQLQEFMRKAQASFTMAAEPEQEPATAAAPPGGATVDLLARIRSFSLKPREIRDYLDRFVIRQEEAKQVLAVAICDHYNHVRRCIEEPPRREQDYAKHNIVLLGPSGVGKTYLMRCAARLIGVPFVKADATKFSETGYVGHDVEDLVRDLVKAADGDVELAQYGIIYMDEIDKIAAKSGTAGKDVSGRGVQVNLLKLMEDTDVSLFSQTDLVGQMQAIMNIQRGKGAGPRTINTRHMLFIVSGAFDGFADQVKRRVHAARIGFGTAGRAEIAAADFLRMATTSDFVEYGFEPEFIGRLPVRIVCDPLTVDDLEQIMLRSEGSVLNQYAQDMAGYGIELKVDSGAVRAIAERGHDEKTGARGLLTVLERMFRGFKYELPSTAIRALDVDRETVEQPGPRLAGLLKANAEANRAVMLGDVAAFTAAFAADHGIPITFEPDAAARVVALSGADGRTVRAFCEALFHDLQYAVKLVARNTGATGFVITRAMVDDPERELSRRIRESFGRSPAA